MDNIKAAREELELASDTFAQSPESTDADTINNLIRACSHLLAAVNEQSVRIDQLKKALGVA